MRKQSRYSQAELAKLSGINLRSIQDYEQGHKLIASAKGETLYRLSQVLGYSIEDILTGSSMQIDVWKNGEERTANRILAYESALDKQRKAVVHFPVIIPDDKIDMSRIYPTKQRMVKSVIDQIRGDLRISSVRLFGSSITMRCSRESDLDFAIGLVENTDSARNDISEKIQLCCEWEADILWLDRLTSDDRIYENIMNGLVLI